MASRYVIYNKCRCGNKKVDVSKQCQECHNKKTGMRLSQILQNEKRRENDRTKRKRN